MNQTRNKLAILIVATFAGFVGVTFIPGCFGTKARDGVVAPALEKTADPVEFSARGGAALLPEAEQAAASAICDRFFAAVESKDRVQIAAELPAWLQVKVWAQMSIEQRKAEGAIGPGIAASLHENLARFEEALNVAAERVE